MKSEDYKVKIEVKKDREGVMDSSDDVRCQNDVLKFRRVELEDIGLMRSYFGKYPSRSCDYSIGGVMMWREYFNYELAVVSDTLFLRGYDPERGVMLYYMPIGKLDPEQASAMVMEASRNDGRTPLFIYAEETSFDRYCEELVDNNDYLDEWKEYVYDIEQFIHFSGKKMEKKRNHLNYFMNHYEGFEVEPISQEVCGELVTFTEKFAEGHADSEMMNYESARTIDVLKEYQRYPFEGLLIRYKGRVIGYTFGEKSGDTFFVHVEKGDVIYRGIYQALSSKLAGYIRSRYPDVRYLNREEDMGNEYLRKSKESYHPCMIVNKHQSQIPLCTLIEEAILSMVTQNAS